MPEPLDLDAVEARLEAGAPAAEAWGWFCYEPEGQWVVAPGWLTYVKGDPLVAVISHEAGPDRAWARAALIAHAPADLRALVAEVRRLRQGDPRPPWLRWVDRVAAAVITGLAGIGAVKLLRSWL